ncbi:MAG TPA: class I SAM-dependent methyltransferase [Gemmatimonadaceae bacterium]|nr:class I SAM-dependent methyltransferase [Gemmatimonadaceae bacterium]
MRSTAEWRFWGRYDPMWAVATWEGRQHDGPHPWTIDDFLAAGRSDCTDIMRQWNQYGRKDGGRCVEIGCGAGRLTSALVDYFDRVLAIDVSVDQIELAKRFLGASVTRVTFSIVEEPVLDVRPGTCSAMISTFVFQHLSDYSGIVAYLRAAHRALQPGASICFQTPVPGADNGDLPSAAARTLDSVRSRVSRALGRRRFMEYNRYPVERIVSTLEEIGFQDVEMRIVRLASTNRRQSFFFARKPGLHSNGA